MHNKQTNIKNCVKSGIKRLSMSNFSQYTQASPQYTQANALYTQPGAQQISIKLTLLMLLSLASLLLNVTAFAQDQLGNPVQISAPQVVFGDVQSFQVSPDGSRVVYVADQNTDGVFELFSVPTAGGTAVRLNPNLVNNGGVSSVFQFSPDGSRVVYIADQNTDGVNELFSVPTAGGTAVRLNSNLVSGGDVFRFEISPDSSRVVYQATQTNNVVELFSVPIADGTGTAVRLNSTLVTGGSLSSFQISPDGSRVVYTADQNTDGVIELFSVPIGGGTAVRLNPNLVSGGDISFNPNFQISPDGSRVVYVADQITDGVNELFSVPIIGGSAVRLNSNLVTGGSLSSFQISPDGSRVVYNADQITDGVPELFSVPIAGGTAVRLNPDLDNNNAVFSLRISPDSSRVAYTAGEFSIGIGLIDELFSVPIAGGTVERVNDTLPFSADVGTFEFSPNSQFIIYIADQNVFDENELFSVALPQPAPDETQFFVIPLPNGGAAVIPL